MCVPCFFTTFFFATHFKCSHNVTNRTWNSYENDKIYNFLSCSWAASLEVCYNLACLSTFNMLCKESKYLWSSIYIWAATRQNQLSDCAPSEDSVQPGHPPSLIRVFAVRMKKAWVLNYPMSAAKTLIRLGGCPGWSESSLVAQSFCWFCHEAAHL